MILKSELAMKGSVSLPQRLQALRRGFLSASWQALGLNKSNFYDYMPDIPQLLFEQKINKDLSALDNKLYFRCLYSTFFDIPENLCLFFDGRLFPLNDGVVNGIHDFEGLLEYVKAHGSAFWKPTSGRGGRGAFSLTWDSSTGFRVNGRPTQPAHIIKIANSRSDYVVCRSAKQAAYANSIFPGSANTLRIRTMTDPLTKRAFVAAAAHRFGTSTSGPVDNWAAGGIAAPINVEDGRIGRACRKPRTGTIQWLTTHPDTNAPIEGVKVPHWQMITQGLIKATESYPGVSGSGWDVIATDNGFTVIEGNNFPTLLMLQLGGGILKDERVRRYYKHYEVLA